MLVRKFTYINIIQDNIIIMADYLIITKVFIGFRIIIFLKLKNYHKTTLLSCFKEEYAKNK